MVRRVQALDVGQGHVVYLPAVSKVGSPAGGWGRRRAQSVAARSNAAMDTITNSTSGVMPEHLPAFHLFPCAAHLRKNVRTEKITGAVSKTLCTPAKDNENKQLKRTNNETTNHQKVKVRRASGESHGPPWAHHHPRHPAGLVVHQGESPVPS